MASFNPLDTSSLTKIFVNELTSRPAIVLPEINPQTVEGPGLYALYYSGSFGPYDRVASAGTGWPIYLGSALPPGSGTGQVRKARKSPILERLERHTKSVALAANLEEWEFKARWFEVDEPFIILGEILLVRFYRPLWNSTVRGFGSKMVGEKRTGGRTSKWDTLHPGRGGTGTSPGASVDRVEDEVAAHLAEFPPNWSLTSLGSAHAARDD
jgi:hypothetical protein